MQTNSYQHISDQELLDKFRQDGNNQWLGIVLQRYTLLLLGVCMKYLKNEEAAKDDLRPKQRFVVFQFFHALPLQILICKILNTSRKTFPI